MSIEDGLGSFRRRFDLILLRIATIVLVTNGAALLGIVGRHGDCEETERVRMMRTRICGESESPTQSHFTRIALIHAVHGSSVVEPTRPSPSREVSPGRCSRPTSRIFWNTMPSCLVKDPSLLCGWASYFPDALRMVYMIYMDIGMCLKGGASARVSCMF